MVNEKYKSKVSDLIKLAKQKGLIKKYSDFCDTDEAEEYALSGDEVICYTSKKGEKSDEEI